MMTIDNNPDYRLGSFRGLELPGLAKEIDDDSHNILWKWQVKAEDKLEHYCSEIWSMDWYNCIDGKCTECGTQLSDFWMLTLALNMHCTKELE